ncbi:hypothetical protein GCM10027291_16460 [Telluribacter humicola]
MYHKFSEGRSDYLTVTTSQFRRHLGVLAEAGYHFITLQDWLYHIYQGLALPPRPVLLTFDDAYVSNLTLAYPLLKEFGARATLFVPTAYVGSSSGWDEQAEELLSVEQLGRLNPEVFELALHTHRHLNYRNTSPDDMATDLRACVDFFVEHRLTFVKALAYPYGGRPADPGHYEQMLRVFRENNIQAAFRIGNRINASTPRNIYDINRIDIRGTDSLFTFRRKVAFGRLF